MRVGARGLASSGDTRSPTWAASTCRVGTSTWPSRSGASSTRSPSAGEDRHVSLHVRTQRDGARTAARRRRRRRPRPPEWTADADLVAGSRRRRRRRPVGSTSGGGTCAPARARAPCCACATSRRRRAGRPRARRGPAGQRPGRPCRCTSGVVSAARGRRLAERAVHRVRSDGATGAGGGLSPHGARRPVLRAPPEPRGPRRRRTRAAAPRGLRDGARRVAGGARRPRRAGVRSALHDAGVDTERGRGRQALWFCRSLPGGPGW